MAWLLLAGAIAAEVTGTISLKYAEGFTRWLPSTVTAVGYLVSLILLGRVAKDLPISVIYAVWSGAGTAIVAGIGFTVLGEPVSLLKVAGIGLIIGGVVAINVGGGH